MTDKTDKIRERVECLQKRVRRCRSVVEEAQNVGAQEFDEALFRLANFVGGQKGEKADAMSAVINFADGANHNMRYAVELAEELLNALESVVEECDATLEEISYPGGQGEKASKIIDIIADELDVEEG